MADLKSWNPWHGCTKYSAGCDHCYMYALDKARRVPEKSSAVVRTKSFYLPVEKTRRGHYKIPAGYCLRVNMASDTFVEEADEWRPEMWKIIRSRPDVRFYILTKRAQRMTTHLPDDWGEGYENVQLNITCENQHAFDERWPILRDLPARHKGMNLAPLIGPIDVEPALKTQQIEHIDLGGESFGGKRPCHYEWVKQISDACEAHKVNFVFNSTGDVFVKEGKTYHIENKRTQAIQAFRSRLSRFFGLPQYHLYHPLTHHLLAPEELIRPVYNADRCLQCTSFETCIGCQDCGACKQVRLVEHEEILRLRAEQQL